jgi:hypothetical protein
MAQLHRRTALVEAPRRVVPPPGALLFCGENNQQRPPSDVMLKGRRSLPWAIASSVESGTRSVCANSGKLMRFAAISQPICQPQAPCRMTFIGINPG